MIAPPRLPGLCENLQPSYGTRAWKVKISGVVVVVVVLTLTLVDTSNNRVRGYTMGAVAPGRSENTNEVKICPGNTTLSGLQSPDSKARHK